jgi:hypothetical protein
MASGRRGLLLLPLIAATQLLLYVALDGPLPRYRYPMQPLITLVASAGLTLMLAPLISSRVSTWLSRQARLASSS